jgi:hypothetical protein
MDALDAHVIDLQEIADRAALERVFPPAEWHMVIDDDSTNAQDLAVAVRKPLRIGVICWPWACSCQTSPRRLWS